MSAQVAAPPLSDDQPWRVRPFEPGDEHALVALHGRVTGESISPAHWLWKYRSHGSAIQNVWLAEAEGAPVFQYAGTPAWLEVDGRRTLAMISTDTMTAPAYRRRGLLTQVGKITYANWKEAGISFVIGLPNQQWGSRKQALGWRPVGSLRWWVRPLRPGSLLAAKVGWRRLGLLDGPARALEQWLRPSRPGFEARRISQATRELDVTSQKVVV